MNKEYCTIINENGDIIKVKASVVKKCFDNIISPLDIISETKCNDNVSKDDYITIIDKDMNLYKVESKNFEKIREDVISQVANETEKDLVHELNINYVKKLENGLMGALDELANKNNIFDYYDKLRELTDFDNYQTLDFLDMFSDN